MEDIGNHKELIWLNTFGGCCTYSKSSTFSFFLKIVQWTRTVFMSIVTVFVVYGNLTAEGGLDESSFFISIGILCTFQNGMGLVKETHLHEILSVFHGFFHRLQEPWEKALVKKETKWASLVSKFYFRYIIFFTVSYTVVPLLLNMATQLFGYETHFTTPSALDSIFPTRESRQGLIYNICIGISGLYFLQLGLSSVAAESTVFFLVSYNVTLMKLLKQKLLKLNSETEEWDLKEIVQIHQMLWRAIKITNVVLGEIVVSQNIISATSICLGAFTLTKVMGEDMTKTIIYIGYMNLLFGIELVTCATGQFLESEAESIFNTLCKIEWYKQENKVQKDLVMMLRQSKRPIQLSYGGVSPLNIQTFSHILNASYSYFMLLRSSN